MIPKRTNVKKILNEHSKWIFSSGRFGKLADIKSWKLDRFNLENEDLPFAKLHFVSLKSAKLSGINFRQADLLQGIFVGAYLDDADLARANLSGGDFSFSNCMGANFTDATLEGVNFEGADLSETNFARATLRCANFKGANLSASEMIDADIEGANFQGANLEGTNFEGVDLFKADFDEIYLRDIIPIINLSKIDHKDANFTDFMQDATNSPEIELNNHLIEKTGINQKPSIKSSKEDLIVDLDVFKPDVIEEAILDLIENLKSNIQFDLIKAICKQQNLLDTIDKFDFKNGDIVTHDDQVAFKLDYNISYNLSLLLDRKGKLINVYRSIANQIEK
jgi:uncharacterized protein YjbI with pentapeptide repeats